MKTPTPNTHRAQQRRDQLFELAESVSLLPSTLTAPMKVLQLHRAGGASMEQYGEALATDASLVSKILGLVNSAAFKPAQPVTRLSQALVMIGLKNLLPLVFGVSLAGIFNKFGVPADERAAIWRAVLLKAVAAREHVRRAAPEQTEEAFLAALLQDIALPIIYANDRSAWAETTALLDMTDAAARTARERALYGTDHGELGAVLAHRLGIPDFYREATCNHDMPAKLSAGGNEALARALSVAATLPHRLLPNMPNLKPRLLAAFGTGDPELIGRVGEAYAQTLTQFAEADEKSGAFKEFMQALSAQVALCMESAIGESTTVIAELRDKGTVLERHVGDLKQKVTQSEYDTLTKVFTRAGFMTRAARFVAMARENRAVSALGFVDIDDFKKMNDQHGHEAGDRALTTVATTLVAALRGDGIVGRMGGDEFCFVLFAKDHTSLAKAFEHIENAFCHLDVDVADAKQARLSSSVGIVALEDQGPPPDLEKMIKNADELMYGAKRAGKGRCFTRTSRAA